MYHVNAKSTVPEVVLGIDPGTNLLGYAFIRTGEKKPRLLQMGVLDMRKMDTHIDKLSYIFHEVQRLMGLFTPTCMAVEAPFYHKDVQAMLKLGRAQGMAIAAAFACGITVNEYLPKVVKKAVTGNGNASKEQVAGMLGHLVEGNMHADFKDATDALAVAVCHVYQNALTGSGSKRYNSWSGFIKDNPDKLG